MQGSESAETFQPLPWYPLVVAVVGVVAVIVIRLFVDLPMPAAVIGPLAGAYGATRALRLTLSASGVTMANRSFSWETLELRTTRWGDSIRTHAGVAPRMKRLKVFLPIYESNWRSGTLGGAIERWAPHLLSPPASTAQADDASRH